MVFASLKNKLVSLIGSVINQVCSTVPSSTIKAVHDVLPVPGFKAYGFLQDIYHSRFQLAKDDGYSVLEELGKIPVQTDYNSNIQFSSVGEAKAAMSTDLLDAYCSPLPGKFDSPQLYCNMSPFQQMLTDRRADEENFDFVDYPGEFDDEAIPANQPAQEVHVNPKKKGYLKSLKTKLLGLSKK
ncbi:unnamed protein product [Mucor fragilis]